MDNKATRKTGAAADENRGQVPLLNLTPEQKKEIADDLKFKDEVVSDFQTALADAASIELNKRRVSGGEYSHWLNLAMCGGELALVHVQTLDRLEKMVAANRQTAGAETDAKKI